jgi:Protein of unknown function (DUF3107)
VQVRIGVTYIPREIEIELADDADPAEVRASVEQAMSNGASMLWLTDRKGHQVGVAVDKLAYVDLGTSSEHGRIGFGAP